MGTVLEPWSTPNHQHSNRRGSLVRCKVVHEGGRPILAIERCVCVLAMEVCHSDLQQENLL